MADIKIGDRVVTLDGEHGVVTDLYTAMVGNMAEVQVDGNPQVPIRRGSTEMIDVLNIEPVASLTLEAVPA